MEMNTTKLLEYVSISSSINPSFWNKLSEIKLDEDKLNEIKHPIWGYFSNINNKSNIPVLEVNSTSFNKIFESQRIYIPFHGQILNVNTLEQFRECDKTNIINNVGDEILKCIMTGEALKFPSLLNQFFILSFSDLKKFHFYYWFAFPVPHNLHIECSCMKNICEELTAKQLNELWDKYCELEINQKPFFLINLDNQHSLDILQLKNKLEQLNEENYSDYYFVYYDLSIVASPGTTLRNYITLLLYQCPFLQGKSVKFLSLRLKRDENSKPTFADSIILKLTMPICHPSIEEFINGDPKNRWVGWEKNERDKMGPRLSNMKKFMDPKELAESSVDLNLKLMKWRILSNINLEIIKLTKFLLLGSGTLGCSVARILLGWGARNISFVDNSSVSYSNPVRQSLFTFEDSKKAKAKSVAAADNLRNIFPGVNANAFQLTIPMPGHSIGESMLEQVKSDIETLVQLVQEHDIIFLLMDSRESRWLPTVLGTYFNKVVINAALGFDSYLVMRHGVKIDLGEFNVRQHPPGFKSLKGNYLGCYFCNDVTAPGDSMKDRTLDQQCTVTRPGVSAIAGALSAELAISILQHKEGAKAPAFFKVGSVANTSKEIDYQCVLGLIPHSIRGYLSTFSQVLPATERYQQCVACSEIVQNSFRNDGFSFLLKVFENSNYLEDITGLSQLKKEAENIGVWELSDEEEIDCVSLDNNTEYSVEYNKSQGDTLVDHSHIIEKDSGIMDEREDSIKNEDKENLVIKSEADEVAKTLEEDSLGNASDVIEENQENFVSTALFNKLTEEVFQQLLDRINAAKSVGDVLELGMTETSNTISSHAGNCVLTHDLITILEKKNIFSSTESFMIVEELNEIKNIISDETKSISQVFSDEICQETEISSSESQETFSSTSTVVDRSNVLKGPIILKYSSRSILEDKILDGNVPKELLPILEKQKALSGLKFNLSRRASEKTEANEMKWRTDSSTSTFQPSLLEVESLKKEDVKISPTLNTIKSYVDSSSSDSKEMFENKKKKTVIDKIEVLAKELKKSVFNIVNWKSKLKNSVSTDLQPHMVEKIDNENSTRKLENMDQRKLEKDNMILNLMNSRDVTSSDSLSLDECFSERIDVDKNVIFLSKPQEFCSSSSLTSSDNFGINESVYYLAETDSDKTVKG